MSPRDATLEAVRKNLPRPEVPLPEIPRFPGVDEPILPYFRRQLEVMGGRSFEVPDAAAARAKVAELFGAAKVDIEGVIIHGAQGARSLTVLLLAPSGVEALGL